MVRKMFCYSCFSLETLSISYVVYSMVIKAGYNPTLLNISLVFGTLNIFILLIAFLCYGAPKNSYKEYMIRYISYNDILKENHKLIVEYKDGIWQFFHRDKYYKFNLKGWPNIKKRVSDIIFIQYHNNYCNSKKVKNHNYTKNYFKQYKIQIEFIKNNKSCIKKFKPSWILKLKLLISISQFHGKYQGNNVRKRDIWDTFMVFPFIEKKRNKINNSKTVA